jgi:hypothetical protein
MENVSKKRVAEHAVLPNDIHPDELSQGARRLFFRAKRDAASALKELKRTRKGKSRGKS